ncbi:MAG: glycine cleavage system protein H [Clostridia bacterium]|nr:glycine cleavage system protein H [Clostridia bacterium]MBQ4603052.1 glycine cleavage system protein H [Clostridia bacterium]
MRYSKNHCWVKKTENGVLIGITDFAVKKICKSFEIFLCDENEYIHAGESIGEIISCEFFDILSPVSGTVIRVNEDVLDNPKILVETNPWLVEMTDVAFTQPLMSEHEYDIYLNNLN